MGLLKIQETEIQLPVPPIENVFSVAHLVNIIQYTAQSATRVGNDRGTCKLRLLSFYLLKSCHWHSVKDVLDW